MAGSRRGIDTTDGTVTVGDDDIVIRRSPWAVFRRKAASDVPGLDSRSDGRVQTGVALTLALLTLLLAGYSLFDGSIGFAIGSVVPLLVLYLSPWFRNTRIPRSAVEDVQLDPDSQELTLIYRSVDQTDITTFGPTEAEQTLTLRSVDDVHAARANFRGLGLTEVREPAERPVDGTETPSGDRELETSY